MDKYTVDLDKVLNDFEYSEYSLESAKVNRNVQDEIPNTSYNSGYSVKNDTAVKHTINNVFHSLNEYLSSDITPKKVDVPSKKPNNSEISAQLSLVSFVEQSQLEEVQISDVSPINFQGQPSQASRLDLNNVTSKSIIPISDDVCVNQSFDTFHENTLEKTDIYNKDNSISNVNTEDNQQALNEENDEVLVDLKVEQSNSEEFKNETGETVSIVHNSQLNESKTENEDVSTIQNEVSEDILLDLSLNIEPCNKTNNKLIEALHFENEKYNENDDNAPLTIETENGSDQPISCGDKDEVDLSSDESKPYKTVISGKGGNQIGFKDDFDLDEEKLDLYFQELEKELEEESKMPQVVDLESCTEVKNQIELTHNSEMNRGDVKSVIEEVADSDDKIMENQAADQNNLEIIVTKSATSELSEVRMNQPVHVEAEEITSDTNAEVVVEATINNKMLQNSDFEEATNSVVDTKEISKESVIDKAHHQAQEGEKNNRPQLLILNEEVPETTRKISLIGEPGSTPYNNEYSTKEFEKNQREESGAARAISPTYSDVSTDSISSSGSDDTEYNDAVSEMQDDKKTKNSEVLKKGKDKEPIQNNMIHSVDLCKNDVTIDKDFKNNLKSNAVEGNDEASGVEGSNNEDCETDQDKGECCAICPEDGGDEHTETLLSIDQEALSEERRIEPAISHSLGIDWLGKQAPLWIPDNEAMSCLHCDMKFTVIKRRHHCRACGLVLCSKCCNLKYRLEYLDAEARVCKKCYDVLNKDTNSSSGSDISQELTSPSRNMLLSEEATSLGQPNPNNPLEYCSTLPPLQQVDPNAAATPSVMVPVGVLKRKGSNKGRSNKSVMFCDGIRPGSDLTNLDTDFNYSNNHKGEKSKKLTEKAVKISVNSDMLDMETRSFIPSDSKGLPPTVAVFKTDVKYTPCVNDSTIVEILREEALVFALHSNVHVHVKIINMDCCVSRMVWCFSTEGLINVGQDELVILLEVIENENCVPKEIFLHLNNIYLEAVKGSSVKELGLSLHTSSPFMGSKNHAGFVYIRPTFQCLQNVIIPKEPYLIGILIHRWETPWAKLFPLRLVLRLGAEYKYYPSPIISTRDRDSVFVEIGHTIINLLADFRNFSYTLPQIRGLTIHMEDKNTTITIPVNRYDQVLKGLSNSSDHILAFAGNFSTVADSHLVCIQDTQSATNNYTTHAINICNQPRKVTGASFIVFNGALKSSSGLTAKSNIVEDGLMIQILPEHMLQVRESLKNMKDHTIKCGCVNEESDETVTITWGEPDCTFNVAVMSPIDAKSMTGIPSIRVHNGKDYACNSGSRLIRWTEVFIMQSNEEASRNQEGMDISKISENIAKATCQALVKYLDLLVSNSFYKIGLRAHLHVENVSYSAGSNNVKLPPIYMKSLDNELIPVLHRLTSNNVSEQPIVLELVFRILNM